jgi:hypothetical protein
VDGHKLVLMQEEISKRSENIVMTVEEFDKLNEQAKGAIITVEDVVPPPFEAAPQPTEDEVASVRRQKEWEAAKEAYDREIAAKPAKKKVCLWLPVRITHRVELDGQEVKIYHTLRGPVMGVVLHEDMDRAVLYSPCIVSPEVQKGRVHYLPIAFAGFEMSLSRRGACFGESVPQESEIMGYPRFIEMNRKGDYRFVMRAAYHHIDANLPEDGALVSVEAEPPAPQSS